MLVNSSLLRCRDTYLCYELYWASEFLFYHYVKRFLDFLLLPEYGRSRRDLASARPFLGPYYLYIVLKKNTRGLASIYNQPKPMQPNILLLVAFAEINASCSCSLAEDIKKWTVNLKNSIDKPIYFLTNVETLKWWCFHRRPHVRISEYKSIRVQMISANAKVFRQIIGLSLHLCRGS